MTYLDSPNCHFQHSALTTQHYSSGDFIHVQPSKTPTQQCLQNDFPRNTRFHVQRSLRNASYRSHSWRFAGHITELKALWSPAVIGKHCPKSIFWGQPLFFSFRMVLPSHAMLTLNAGNIHHHTVLLQCHWLFSLCRAFYSQDLFIP